MQYLTHFRQFRINFLWVPSHRGMDGNERADLLSRSASQETPALPYALGTDLISSAERDATHAWKTEYPNHLHPLSFYLKIQPQLPTQPIYTLLPAMPRKFFIIISRLRLGHNRLSGNLARFVPSVPHSCPLHSSIPQHADLHHYIFQCPAPPIQKARTLYSFAS